uniref:Aspartyl/asparaginy/proline hydroxylase domain-containing protein n=1 Tax=Panagrolaimus sp. ES5 TaxID=591445 RepID=A0AC34GGC3_9BILA
MALNRAKTFVEKALLFSSGRVKNAISSSLNNENALLFRIPDLSSRSLWTPNFWGSNITDDIQKLEDNHATIKLACLKVLKNASIWQRKDDGAGGTWFIYPLLKNGFWCDEYCNVEPELMEIIHSLNSIMHKCVFGSIYFSLLPPKTKIQNHLEPTNIRLKCHLGIEVPKEEEACFLTTATNE